MKLRLFLLLALSVAPLSFFSISTIAEAADLFVGTGCPYQTVQSAINAAQTDDRILLQGGKVFTENLYIDKSLSIVGALIGCSGNTSLTTIDGNGSGRVIDIAAGLEVSLTNLNITNGTTTYEGGGIRFALGTEGGTLTLSTVNIYSNTADYGGGIWAGQGSKIEGKFTTIYQNSATIYGGGLRLYGASADLDNGRIYQNQSPKGAGIYATTEATQIPVINLLESFDVEGNQALTGDGLGGGVYINSGVINISDCSDIQSNQAISGGGLYLIQTTLNISGSCSEIQQNTASGDGGGIHATNSSIDLDDEAEIYSNESGGHGGGAYLDNSNFYSDNSSTFYNSADRNGGGIYAGNGSRVDFDLGDGYPITPRSILRNNSADGSGGAVYSFDSSIDIQESVVRSNTATLGGGVYMYGGYLYLYNTLLTRNNATSTTIDRGDAIRLYDSATMLGRYNTFGYNDLAGAATGIAISIWGSAMDLDSSIIWGHDTAISDTGGGSTVSVDCSDIQGGYSGTNNLNVNPLFVDSTSNNFHLQVTSPVADRCNNHIANDFEKDSRPFLLNIGRSDTPYDMGCDEAVPDFDGDRIPDHIEHATCTDPNRRDTDGDGLDDGVEDQNWDGVIETWETSPCNDDTDDDGILDPVEIDSCTDANNSDTDNDNIPDGIEDTDLDGIFDDGETDPCERDTDGEGLYDGVEDSNYNGIVDTGETDPRLADTDSDGLSDQEETAGPTDPLDPDSDDDFLLDGVEDANNDGIVNAGETDPMDDDTDNDNLLDGIEDANRNGLFDSGETNPNEDDTDSDGLNDGLEDINLNGSVDPGETDPRTADTDSDGLEDGLELIGCTDPLDADSDDDGLLDGTEDQNANRTVDAGETNPCSVDTDGDGIQDGTESGITLADIGPDTDQSIFIPDADPSTTTDPTDSDTDNDGLSDGEEDLNFNGRVDSGETDPDSKPILAPVYMIFFSE